MKYYLAYLKDGEYIPIELKGVEPSILSVVGFTTKFMDLSDLIDYLDENSLIPNRQVSLHYVISKGKKGNKYYEPLKGTSIYTSSYKGFFTKEAIKKQLVDKQYNEEFIMTIYAEYIKKMGLLQKILDKLKNKKNNTPEFIVFLRELSIIPLSKELKSSIYTIINYYNRNSNFKVSKMNELIDDFINSIRFYNGDIVNIYIFSKERFNLPKIPTLVALNEWFSVARDINSRGFDNHEYDYTEYRNIDIPLNNFFNSICYDYDYKNRVYKTKNGVRKIKDRSLFDLGIIVEKYYIKVYNEYKDKYLTVEDDSFDEDAEFLTEEDFERIGTTSSEEGIKIRKR